MVVQNFNDDKTFFGNSSFFTGLNHSDKTQKKPLSSTISPLAQRQEEEEELQMKDIQRLEEEEELQIQPMEEESVQLQTEEEEIRMSAKNDGHGLSLIESDITGNLGNGNKMDQTTRTDMEAGFGTDFGNVNIHTDSAAIQMSRHLHAHAFTHGNDIFFNKGKYSPRTDDGKHLLAHELTHTLQQASPGPSIQKNGDQESNLDRLNEMLDRWNVPEEEVISICSELSERERTTVRTNGSYKTRMANALNVGEMVRAVNNLGFSLETKLNWVKASATFGTLFLEYDEIRSMVTTAPQPERDALKTSATAGQRFFIEVCTNETMVTALNDLQFDLITKLTWLKAEMTITSWELSYPTIQPWIIHANTTQAERDSLKTNTIVGKDFFVDVCTNVTMVTALNDLQFDLITKLTWLKAEMTITSWELSYPTIQPWIIHANTTQAERDSLKTNTIVGMDFFVDVCTNATMVTALNDLQFDLITKLTWLKAEMTITSWELSYPTIQPWIIHANTTQAERDSLKTETWKEFFINVCTNVTIIEAVNDLQFDLKTKIEWVRTEAGLEEVKRVIELATQADRDVVWNDAAYLSTLRSEVGDDYYL
jgi:hypothetical protein